MTQSVKKRKRLTLGYSAAPTGLAHVAVVAQVPFVYSILMRLLVETDLPPEKACVFFLVGGKNTW